jgi:hypothetical protein
MKQLVTILGISIVFLISCAKPQPIDDPSTQRLIRYEVAGNFTGVLFASYTTASGGTVNEQVTSLLWVKEVTYASNVPAAIIAVSGNGGAAGQQVTVVVKKGGNQVSSTPVTANSLGSFTQAAPVVTF